MKKVLISAGEASGDFYGAKLALEIFRLKKDKVSVMGFGGPKMKAAGVDVMINPMEHALIGFWEFFRKSITLIKLYFKAVGILKKEMPDALIVIDSPTLNMPLIKKARQFGVKKIIYYSTPQVWAWKPGRIKNLKKFTDLCVVVLPFEEKLLVQAGIKAKYFGHPMAPYLTPAKPSAREKVVGIFPGSRINEVMSFTEDMLKACSIIKLSYKKVKFVLFRAQTIDFSLLRPFLDKYPGLKIKVVDGTDLKMKSSLSAAIAKSGTITLELAIMGVPMAIVYRVSQLSYLIMKNTLKLKHVGLPNILLKKTVVREFLQHDFKPDKVGREIIAILKDRKYSAQIAAELNKFRVKKRDASKVVVNIAKEIIREAGL